MAFTPHTPDDIQAMLAAIGVNQIDDLFDEIPKNLRLEKLDSAIVPEAITELEANREFKALAEKDKAGLCFIGAGAYEHHIPAAVWQITSRGEFMTAYTPYQAEASQGSLQLLYEYQTMMASLMGLDIANASLYDGASALAEAILMAIRCQRKLQSKRVLIPTSLHPQYRSVVDAIVKQQGVEIIDVPYCTEMGRTQVEALAQYNDQEIAALVIPQPNFFGVLEDVDALVNWAEARQVMTVACVNPMAMALLKEPGAWGQNGVDIACGEGQPLGVPLASGGPYVGFMACKQNHVRQLPGRLVGRTVDLDGHPGFTLTLQAREQHIRRSKATSNICTNQGLLVTAATIYMCLMGPEGLRNIAGLSHQNTLQLAKQLTELEGVEQVFRAPVFHELVLRLPRPVKEVLHELAAHGIQGGYDLSQDYPELGQCLLVCATETKTKQDLEYYQQVLKSVLTKSTSGQGQSANSPSSTVLS